MVYVFLLCTIWYMLCAFAAASAPQDAPAADRAAVTTVTTAQQLKDAVVRGDPHIEIQAHLDMSTVDPVDFRILGILPATVKSIHGNCSTPLPSIDALGLDGAPLLPAAPRMCLVATDMDLLYAWNDSVWLDHLYLRLKRTERTDLPVMLHANKSPAGTLWATDCAFQGDGQGSCRAVYADASVLIHDSTIADMSRDEASVIVRMRGNSVALRNCTFRAAPAPPPPAGAHAPAVQAQVASAVRLEGVTFAGYGLVYLLMDSQGTAHFFSDEERLVWDEELRQQRTSRGLADAAELNVFLSMEDEWLQEVQRVSTIVQVLPTLPRRPAPSGDATAALQATLQGLHESVSHALEVLPLDNLPGAHLSRTAQAAIYAAAAAAVPLLLVCACICWPRQEQSKAKQS